MKRADFLFFIAVLALLFVIADLGLWFSATSGAANLQQARQGYLAHYPVSMQSVGTLTILSVVLLTFAGFVIFKHANLRLKMLGAILALLAAILLIWKIFSLTYP